MKYKISDIAEINKKNINKNYKGKVFYLDTSSVTNDFFNCPKIYTSLKEAPIRARRLAEDGDTIISTVRPAMRHVGYISQNLNRVYSTGFAIISPKKSKVNPFYLYLVLSSKEITNLLQSIAVGSTSAYPSIKPRDIGNLTFDFPSLCIQEKIASIMQQIILKIKMNNQINDNLGDYINQNIYLIKLLLCFLVFCFHLYFEKFFEIRVLQLYQPFLQQLHLFLELKYFQYLEDKHVVVLIPFENQIFVSDGF